MSVAKNVRSEVETVVVQISGGEFLQYLVSTPVQVPRFSLMDANSHEVILSDRVPATILSPATYTRLWPVVGDRPQRESSLILAMNFSRAGECYTFQVQHRKPDGVWTAAIDIEFQASAGGDSLLYAFKVVAE